VLIHERLLIERASRARATNRASLVVIARAAKAICAAPEFVYQTYAAPADNPGCSRHGSNNTKTSSPSRAW
jgi:hypothetical protein